MIDDDHAGDYIRIPKRPSLTRSDLEAILYRTGRPQDTQRIREMHRIKGVDLYGGDFGAINAHNQKVEEIMERSYQANKKIRKILWSD